MNERIRELAEQASKQSPDGYPVTIPYSDDFVKKFAELVIKECVDVHVDNYGIDIISDALNERQHQKAC